MKKVLFIGCVIAFAASCSPRLYNVTKSYDKSHFEQLQRIIDNPVTPKEAAFFYTEASELGLIGNMFSDTKVPYHRIDTVRYKGMTKQERYQATCSAGFAVVFSTNSSAISIRTKWGKLKSGSSSNLLSYKGYDLYIKDKSGNWKWAAAAAPKAGKTEAEFVLINNMPAGTKECLLYLPIYQEILSCGIGVEEGSSIHSLPGQFRRKIVFHGSSFTQGICTSRAGMSYPMQFERATGFEVLGFGMSGNCRLQPYFSDVLVDVEADAYVFDTFSNPGWQVIQERLQPFIDKLIAAHPGKPLIFQQTIYRESRNFNTVSEAFEQAKQDIASTLFDTLLKDPKYKDVYFIGTNADSTGRHEYSTDGTHPDDHGYYMWFKSIEKPLLAILAKYGIR